MTDGLASTQTVGLARRWHSTTSRLLLLYGVIFSLSIMVLLGVISGTVTRDMERENDDIMRWQLRYFDSIPDSELRAAMRSRLEHEQLHTSYYGLFAPDGRYIEGDVLALPRNLPTNGRCLTIDHALRTVAPGRAPVVRAIGVRRDDGSTLLVARDLTQVMHIRSTIIKALVAGGILCLGAGVAGGLLLSMRQMRRVAQIRRVTQRISQGDLTQRLPIGGRDELDMLAHLVNHMLAEVERLMNEVKGACDGIAHDLRTPLARVRTLLARIADEAGASDEVLGSLVAVARAQTDALLERFRAMLRISEIGTLNRQGGFAEVRLDELVHAVGDLYEPLAEDRSITLAVVAAPVEPIHGDRALLFEMLTNLVDNAIKFTPHSGTVRVTLKWTAVGPRIEVIDNGPGIPQEEREAVLQRFYRGTNAREIEGSGLGLSIVSAVVRVHDFSMRITDAEPGTRVTIECWSRTLA